MIIQSLPEEPVIKEQNYFEDYLEDRRKQDEQAGNTGQLPAGLRASRQPQPTGSNNQAGILTSNVPRPIDGPTQVVDNRSRVGASIVPKDTIAPVGMQASHTAGGNIATN